jgi:hypothetical protein
MRTTLLMAGLLAVACGAAFAQQDLTFSAGSTNLLLAANGGRILSFSSQMLDENKQPVPQWQVTNLIDGQYVTGTYRPANSHGWSSNATPKQVAPEWVMFSFANEQTRLISRVVLDPTTIDPPLIGRGAKDFELYASATTKDGPWALVKRGQLLNKPLKQTFDFLPVEARYLRLSITSNWGSDRYVELGEVECYEAIAGNDALDQLIVRMESLLGDLKRYRDSVKLNQPIYPELQTAPATTTPGAPGPAAPTTTAPGATAPAAPTAPTTAAPL